MKKFCIFTVVFFLLVSVGYAAINNQTGEFSGRRSFEFMNLTLLVVDAGQEKCAFDYQLTPGQGGLKAPFAKLTFSLGGQKFEATDYQVGNGALIVNNVVYKLNAFKEHLLIGQDGKPTPEQGEIHPGLKLLQDATAGKI